MEVLAWVQTKKIVNLKFLAKDSHQNLDQQLSVFYSRIAGETGNVTPEQDL